MKHHVAGALLLISASQAAQAETAASFRFGGVEFEVPLPAGYCLPQGQDIDVAQVLAAADHSNVTHLTLQRCHHEDGPLLDYILIKTPTQALLARVGREELLEGVGQAFDAAPFASAIESGEFLSEAAEGLSSATGTLVDMSGGIRPLGRDSMCAYLGGIVEISSGVASYSISIGSCITAISDRVVAVHWYGPDTGSAGVAALLTRARRLAETISARPAL